MSKHNLIFSTLLLLAILSVSYLSISSINTKSVVENGQTNDNIEISLNPKSSSYAVTERWNDTTTSIVRSVAVSANGKYMVAVTDAGAGSEILFYNTSNHDGIPMWSVNTVDDINSVAISGTGKYIAVAGDNYTLLYNSTPSAGNIPMWNVTADAYSDYNSVDISANGMYIVLGHRYQTGGPLQTSEVYLYNNSYSSNKLEMWYQQIDNPISSVAISADGNYVAVGASSIRGGPGSDGQITVIDNTDPYSVISPTNGWMWFFKTASDISSLVLSNDGKYLAACGDYDIDWEEIYYFNNLEFIGNPLIEQHTPAWGYNTTVDMRTIAISADGSNLAAGGNWHATDDDLFYFNNTPSANKLPEWSYKEESGVGISSVDMTADGSYVVAGINMISPPTILFFNNSGLGTKTPEWKYSSFYPFPSVSISSWGNYIGAGGGPGGFGKAVLISHARPIPGIFFGNGGGGDDDDDDEEGAIPFGNYYLLFAAIAIASLVIIMKRKMGFNKK